MFFNPFRPRRRQSYSRLRPIRSERQFRERVQHYYDTPPNQEHNLDSFPGLAKQVYTALRQNEQRGYDLEAQIFAQALRQQHPKADAIMEMLPTVAEFAFEDSTQETKNPLARKLREFGMSLHRTHPDFFVFLGRLDVLNHELLHSLRPSVTLRILSDQLHKWHL